MDHARLTGDAFATLLDQPPRSVAADKGADAERLLVLGTYAANDLEDDPELRDIAQFAARLCGAPVAQVTLVEEHRQRFIAGLGLEARETPRSHSFCNHAMFGEGLMEVLDATRSEQFADNPLVTGEPHVRYYAGQPLVSDDGTPLGALCIIDTVPRTIGLDPVQRQGLEVLAQAVMRRLTAHRGTIRAVRDVAEREDQLRTLADAMPAIVFSADAEGKFDYFNNATRQFLGQDSADGSVVHPDDRPAVDAAWSAALATGEPYETEHRLRYRDGLYRWMLARARPVRDEQGRVTRWFGTAVDIDEVHKLSEARDLLSRELAHRIKNIFAVVIGLISLEARRRPDNQEFADRLMGTLRALGRAHDFVRPTEGDTRESFRGLLEVLFAPYGSAGEQLVQVAGDDTLIAPRAATPLALVFHELATNSAKYGALSAEGGHVTLDIVDEGETLRLLWREHGGPVPAAVAASGGADGTSGFGSRLVDMSVTGQLGGSWERRFEPGGLAVELTVSKQAIAP